MRRKKSEQPETPAVGGGRITPIDVQQVEFRLAFRGYNERDVDAFLDRITEDLSHYLEENQRLRSGPVSVASAIAPDDADAARREADEILARAREEAAEIVGAAERDAAALAAAIRSSTAAGTGDARSALAPFLNREREFLQDLGAIVQSHAEEVRSMVMTLRARAEATPATGPASEAAPVGEEGATEGEADLGTTSGAEIRERPGEDDTSEPVDEVVVDATEPVYSAEGAQSAEGRERSLRELFWGDE